MNRVAVWILGTVSGIILVYGISFVSVLGSGYGVSSGCVSYGTNPSPCTPALQQVTINPLAGSVPSLLGFMIAPLLLAILIGLPAWIGGPILAQRRGSSSRTAILIVSIIASAIGIVGLISAALLSLALRAPETCVGTTGSFCFAGGQAKLVGLLGFGLVPLLASLLVGMPAWVMALTETSRRKLWGWFAGVLLFSPIAAMLYGFLGPQPHPPAASLAPTLAASPA